MNVYDKKVKGAETVIKAATLLRLSGIAMLALMLALSYVYPKNLIKLINESNHLLLIIPVFALDFFLTLKWLSSQKLFNIHLLLYILFGGVFYVFYAINLTSIKSSDPYGMIGAIILAAMIWGIGLVPFIIAKVGDNSLARAEAEQRYWKEKAEREQARSGDDKNE